MEKDLEAERREGLTPWDSIRLTMLALESQSASVESELRRTTAELNYAKSMGEKGKRVARLMSDQKALEAYLLDLRANSMAFQGKLRRILNLYEGKYAAAFIMRYLQRGNEISEISQKTGIAVEELEKVFSRMEREEGISPWSRIGARV